MSLWSAWAGPSSLWFSQITIGRYIEELSHIVRQPLQFGESMYQDSPPLWRYGVGILIGSPAGQDGWAEFTARTTPSRGSTMIAMAATHVVNFMSQTWKLAADVFRS